MHPMALMIMQEYSNSVGIYVLLRHTLVPVEQIEGNIGRGIRMKNNEVNVDDSL
jgi:hypothetical protein